MSNDTRPEIRFPGFTEDWEERKLIDLVVRLNKVQTPVDFQKLNLKISWQEKVD